MGPISYSVCPSFPSLSLCFCVQPGAKPRAEQNKGASLRQALALLANIKSGWKGLPRANTLAYQAHSKVTEKIKCCKCRPWAVFTTLDFLRNLRLDAVSLSVMLQQNGKPCQGVALQLIGLLDDKFSNILQPKRKNYKNLVLDFLQLS